MRIQLAATVIGVVLIAAGLWMLLGVAVVLLVLGAGLTAFGLLVDVSERSNHEAH